MKTDYLIGMDNYFTTEKVLEHLSSEKIGFVGTGRGRINWPPPEYREIKDTRFNTLYSLPGRKGDYVMCRWVDNNITTMVSNVHTGTETVLRHRKKPRPTNVNRANLNAVWGNEYVREIRIPKIIDDYNYTMNGVDKADQLIAYYRPRVRCRRTWMPIMFHCLDVLRINSYIIVKSLNDANLTHKDYIHGMVDALLARATAEETAMTRRAATIGKTPPMTPKRKRFRMSTKSPSLPSQRLTGDMSKHLHVRSPKQGTCVYCNYLKACWTANGKRGDPPHVRQPQRWCSECKHHLCIDHFDVYHGVDASNTRIFNP